MSPDAELATPVEIAWRAQQAFDEAGIDGWMQQTWHPEVALDMRPEPI